MHKSLRILLFASILLVGLTSMAQTPEFSYKFYGRVRADLFYNSRANTEMVDGLIYLYPKDHDYDAQGNDLNDGAQGNMYAIYTRLGVTINGPMLGSAKTEAKVEADFRGMGTSYSTLRIREAYVNLNWGKTQLLIGQTWHPLFGEVTPSVLNLSSGAPFHPLNRSPQMRVKQNMHEKFTFTAAAVWQQQFSSAGPNGKSPEYLKNGCIPELFAGIDFISGSWTAGASAELLSIKPRKQATVDGKTYRVNERVTSVSVVAHARYRTESFTVSAKTILANNLTQLSMLGGFAVTTIDPKTGECDYTPYRHSITWINAVWGKKWQGGIFAGYLKNLGTGKAIEGTKYGTGLDVDQLVNVSAQISYNVNNWKVGLEFTPATAWYGTTDLKDGKVIDTHSVTNYRILGSMMYTF